MARSLLAGARAAGPGAHSVGQELTVTAELTHDPRTLTHTRRARPAVHGQAARLGCWTGRGRRHAAEFSKPPRCYRLGRLSRTVTVSDPCLEKLLGNISCNASSVVVGFVGPFLFLFPLIGWFFQQALFLVSFPLPAPGRPLLLSSSRVGPVRAASAQPLRTPAGRRTVRGPGLRRGT